MAVTVLHCLLTTGCISLVGHQVINVELHMSWTPAATNHLSSKSPLKSLGFFVQAWQRYYMRRALCYLTHKSAVPFCVAENCHRYTCSERSMLSAWFPPLTTPKSGSSVYNCVETSPAPVGKTAASLAVQDFVRVFQSHKGIYHPHSERLALQASSGRRIKMLPVFPECDGNPSKCSFLRPAIWSETCLKRV